METPIGKEPGNWEKTPGRTAGLRDWPGMSDNTTQIQNSPLLAPGTGSLRRRQSFALLARVVRAAGKGAGAADELAPSHSVYAYPKNPPIINVAWSPAAEVEI